MLIRHARRDIARVNTVLAEKLRAAAPAEKSESKAMSSSKAKEK